MLNVVFNVKNPILTALPLIFYKHSATKKENFGIFKMT